MERTAELLACVQMDLVCIIALVCLAWRACGARIDRTPRSRLFGRALFFAIGANGLLMLWDLHAGGYLPLGQGLAWLVNAGYFLLLELSAFSWFLYAEAVEKKDVGCGRGRLLLLGAPVWLLAALLAVSAFTGWIFSVDGAGVYHRGPLFFLQPLCSYGYVIYTMVKSLQVVLLRKSRASQREYLIIASFAVPVLICGALQYFMPRLSLASAGISISFMLVYLNSLQLMVSQDPLTGISDRRQLLLSLHARADGLREGERLFFCFFDVDDFKVINDRFGHAAGDRVLKLIAGVLRTVCCENNAACGRYGGDEFTVVYTARDELSAERFCSGLQETLTQRLEENDMAGVDLSCGMVELRQGRESVQELITRADRAMYLAKERKKAARYARAGWQEQADA